MLDTLLALDRELHIGSIALCAALAPVGLLVPAAKRPVALTIVATLSVALLFRDEAPAFALSALVAFGAMHALARIAAPKTRWRVALAMIVAVSAFFLVAREAGLPDRRVAFGGVQLAVYAFDMWTCLRVVALFWEVGSGKTKALSAGDFVAWFGLPFTLAGPLLRPAQLVATLHPKPGAKPVAVPRVDRAWAWKVAIAVAQLVAAHLLNAHVIVGHESSTQIKLLRAFFSAPWGFYLWAAGYLSLMEAFGVFWGFALPESFNRPFGRTNLADFWSSWNMSATNLFRDYVFFQRWGFKRPSFYANAFIVFVLVGAWHDADAYWVTWGAYHGIGYGVYLWWKLHKKSFARPWLPLEGKAYDVAAAVFTYVFVCVGWALPPQLFMLFAHLVRR